MTHKLFTPLTLGPLTLQHRVVMAPLTRMRASPDGNVPTALNALYYAQRATPGGLLIAEATPVSWQGHGHPNVPGLHTAAQVEGWRRVTDAVHAARRLHRAAAVAHRARLAFQPPAGRRGAGRPVGHRRAGHDSRCRLEERALRDAARTGAGRDAAAGRQLAPGRGQCDARRLRRRRDPRRQRLPARAVPAVAQQHPHRPLRRQHRKPLPAAPGDRRGGGRRKSAPSAPASACRPGALPTTAARPSRCRCTRTWCASWPS